MKKPTVTKRKSSAALRCLEILRMLSYAEEDLSLQQIADATGLHPSTAHRLLFPLMNLGFVDQQPDRRYCVGMEAIAVGAGFLRRSPIRHAALPFLMRLAEQTKLTVNLGFWWTRKVVIVDSLPMPGAYVFYESGNVVAAHATALGKVLLAHREKSTLNMIGPLDRYTEHTICTAAALAAELAKILQLGFASDNEESLLGCRCLAAPILLSGREPEAAISLTSPTAMMDNRTIGELAELLKERCANISAQLSSRFRGGPLGIRESHERRVADSRKTVTDGKHLSKKKRPSNFPPFPRQDKE